MKLKFDPGLGYQKDAIDAIVGVFEGQGICQTTFTVATSALSESGQADIFASQNMHDIGIGNCLRLIDNDYASFTAQY